MLDRPVVIASTVDPPVRNYREMSGNSGKGYCSHLYESTWCRAPHSALTKRWNSSKKRVSEEAYYDWIFFGRSEAQKLILVQLAEEKLVNPNSRADVRELMREGLVVRACGMLAIKDFRFVQFLNRTISRDIIKEWESEGGGRSNTLRTSLFVTGAAVVIFLLWTQGAVVNTWITYATGLAASIPAFLKLLELVRAVPER